MGPLDWTRLAVKQEATHASIQSPTRALTGRRFRSGPPGRKTRVPDHLRRSHCREAVQSWASLFGLLTIWCNL